MGTVASESTNSFVISAFQVGVKLLPFVTIEKAAETGLSGISVRMSDDHQARSSLILAGSCDKQPTKLNLKLGAEAGSTVQQRVPVREARKRLQRQPQVGSAEHSMCMFVDHPASRRNEDQALNTMTCSHKKFHPQSLQSYCQANSIRKSRFNHGQIAQPAGSRMNLSHK